MVESNGRISAVGHRIRQISAIEVELESDEYVKKSANTVAFRPGWNFGQCCFADTAILELPD